MLSLTWHRVFSPLSLVAVLIFFSLCERNLKSIIHRFVGVPIAGRKYVRVMNTLVLPVAENIEPLPCSASHDKFETGVSRFRTFII